jgi:YggT family protein
MNSFIALLLTVIRIYVYLLIASAILSWLVAFNVVNQRNEVVRTIGSFLNAITEPLLRPIRNVLPNLGGVDVSPIILILLLWFVSNLIVEYGPGLGR